ncbi:Piwi-domain-containing protein [Delitschia confertaspora ATCC 74209]|uniref:Piwi-domain-containing protein n=1 Tax=Delitschia confertaspora ATCC 74209 TaxID=1513339 RepID=A0A9P4JI24_9PLEO|nr:Piwi-domain-containing protein [Delitschia confertaspora ATCC 74209]
MNQCRNGTFPQPDAAVTALENATVKDLSVAFASASVGGDKLPRRPGYGTLGRPVVLWTNYFKLQGIDTSKANFYRYSLSFPNILNLKEFPKPKRKRTIQLLLQEQPFNGTSCASDWAQVVISTRKLGFGDGTDKAHYDIEWYPADGQPLPPASPDDSEEIKKARKRNTIQVLVELIETVSLSELMKDLEFSVSGALYPAKMEMIQTLNIILSLGPSTDANIVTVGQNRYYPIQGHDQFAPYNLGQGLQALRGYFSSARTSVGRILLNINVATGSFYKAGPLLDLMREFGQPENATQHKKLANFVKKLRFETNYLPDKGKDGKPKKGNAGKSAVKRKVHTISDLSQFKQNAGNIKFTQINASGQRKQISVEQYFLQEYGIKLQVPGAPVVNYGTKDDPKWIPAELCTVLPGQAAKRILAPDQTRGMIDFAARPPSENALSIIGDGLKVAKVVEGLNSHLIRFGVKVDPNMLTVLGRILEAPTLNFGAVGHKPRDGKWNLTNDDAKRSKRKFFKGATINNWNCLVINEKWPTVPRELSLVDELKKFRQVLVEYGLTMGPVQTPQSVTIDSGHLLDKNSVAVRQAINGALRQFGAKPQFLFVLLPSDNAFLYDCIKYVCDVQYGIPNVCNIGKKFFKEKGQPQYQANVGLKFNLKMGGINHAIRLDELKPLDPKTIVFGIDVTHPSPGSSEDAPSIAGVVASSNSLFTQYPASIRAQKGRQEMVAGLAEMVIERIRLWQNVNKDLPNKVIVYRDGVSEGQYALVLEKEYPAFVEAFNKLYGPQQKHPKISIITVGKRHHTRFYPTKESDTDKTGNPLPGTVVDRGVTGERLFDFFLLAHQGLQGTSKPCHYVVLKDENNFGADQLQKLTHNLCYTFGRATRSVSLCPPAYYADLLCERGRSYLHNVLKNDSGMKDANVWTSGVHQAVKDAMFYL